MLTQSSLRYKVLFKLKPMEAKLIIKEKIFTLGPNGPTVPGSPGTPCKINFKKLEEKL